MPVMKEDAFIILFASDYVNCRYRVEGRKAQALYYDIREVSTWGTGAEIGTLFYSWLCH